MSVPIWCRRVILLLLAVPLFSSLVQAHEGHAGHEATTLPPAAPEAAAPSRAVAQSERFELVIVPRDGELILYLDRFADNSPVTGAQVEVERGSWQGQAVEFEPGTYRVAAPWLAQEGEHLLLFTLIRGEEADLLDTRLTVSPPAPAGPADAPLPAWLPPLAALALVALLVLFWILRRRGARS